MTMETMRRMRTTSRQVSFTERCAILKTFVSKLRRSGYSANTTQNMIKSGLSFYFRKLCIDLEGGTKMNDRSSSQDITKRRGKMGASQRWFNRRRGGQDEQDLKDHGWRQPSRDNSGRLRRSRTNRTTPQPNPTTTSTTPNPDTSPISSPSPTTPHTPQQKMNAQ